MRRRDFITLVGSAPLLPIVAHAQQRRTMPTIGVLWHAGSAEEEGSNFRALVNGFKDRGYEEGRNIRLEHRFPNEVPEGFRNMAAELVASSVDVLVVVGNNAAPYAKAATSRIPVVFTAVADPIGLGLVNNLARPDGNVTGLSNLVAELIGKRLELLKQIVPGLSRHAVLINSHAQVARRYRDVTVAAAADLGLSVRTFEWRSLDELTPAFKAMSENRMQALTTNPDGLAFTHRAAVATAAIEHRLPLSVWSRQTVMTGGLMAYGADTDAICYRAADYVDRILKGAKPSDLPVEQPTKFELLVNLRTAKEIGLTIPESFLARADEVIE